MNQLQVHWHIHSPPEMKPLMTKRSSQAQAAAPAHRYRDSQIPQTSGTVMNLDVQEVPMLHLRVNVGSLRVKRKESSKVTLNVNLGLQSTVIGVGNPVPEAHD